MVALRPLESGDPKIGRKWLAFSVALVFVLPASVRAYTFVETHQGVTHA